MHRTTEENSVGVYSTYVYCIENKTLYPNKFSLNKNARITSYKILCNEMATCQSNYLINLLSACETLEKTGTGVSIIGISGSSGTTDRFRFIRERVSDTEGSEGGASTSSSIDPRDLLLFLRLKINKST